MSTENFDSFVDSSRKDIWRYAKLLEEIKEKNKISSKQSVLTPIERVGDWLIKREDESLTGSHKYRSLTYQLSYLLDQNTSKAVLSSSGNAAISASRLLPEDKNLKLFVFLSKKTSPAKLAAIKFSRNLVPILSSRPLRLAKYVSKHYQLPDLRPSQDPNAAIGFRSLGFEIFEQKPEIKNIFSFATSGASLQGVQEAYGLLKENGIIEEIPKIFAVRSDGELAGSLSLSAVALAKADGQGVDTSRQSNMSSGHEWTLVDISDEEILSTRQKNPSLKTSAEGLASLAAAEKIKPDGETLVVLTGKVWPEEKPDLEKFFEAENFADVDRIITQHA